MDSFLFSILCCLHWPPFNDVSTVYINTGVWSPVCISEYMLDNCDSLAVVSLKNTLKYCNKLGWFDSQLDYALLLLTLGILEQTR